MDRKFFNWFNTISIFNGCDSTNISNQFKRWIKVLILKILYFLTTASKIILILIIKFNSSKIVRLFDQIKEYQIKSFIEHKYYFLTTITFLLAFISAGLTTTSYFCDLYFNKLFKEFTETQELLPINQKLQVFSGETTPHLPPWRTLIYI